MIQGNKIVSDLTITDKHGVSYSVKGSVQAWGVGTSGYKPGDGLLMFRVNDMGKQIGEFLFAVRADMTATTCRITLDEAYRNRGIATQIYEYVRMKGLTILRTRHADTEEAQYLSASLRKNGIVVEDKFGD